MKKPKQGQDKSFSGLLIGDRLGELAQRLDIGEGNAKLVVLLLGENGRIRWTATPDVSTIELIGALYLAIDQVALGGRE